MGLRRPQLVRGYLVVVIATGMLTAIYALQHLQPQDFTKFVVYVLGTIVVSGLKVKIPGITGNISGNDLFILLGVIELSFGEVFVLACIAAVVQTLWDSKEKPKPVQLAFNAAVMAITAAGAYLVANNPIAHSAHFSRLVLLLAVGTVYCLLNTVPVGLIIGMTEGRPFARLWYEYYFWSFPFYLLEAAIAGLMSWAGRFVGWGAALCFIPAPYLVHRCYQLYFGKLEKIAELHLRTVEVLALAIEAHDKTTHEHLQRVRVYADELGKRMELSPQEREALRAAAVLHDVGKIAVPEHVVTKPGRLTAQEFEIMKMHSVFGAEILGRIEYSYPVVPIVRAHHERWDGSGYPDGLKGEEIPIGARILAVVDCFDALASDRQYRNALSLEEAIAKVLEDSGKAFDPNIVKLLNDHYTEFEEIVRRSAGPAGIKLTPPGKAPLTATTPGAGLSQPATAATWLGNDQARTENWVEAARNLLTATDLNDALRELGIRLLGSVTYDAMVVYSNADGQLIPIYVNGARAGNLGFRTVPVGQGVCGWVAEKCRPVLNGNAVLEPAYRDFSNDLAPVRSAVAVPLLDVEGSIGVLALYRARPDAFAAEELHILLGIGPALAVCLEKLLRAPHADASFVSTCDRMIAPAGTRFLGTALNITGLPQ